MTRYYWSKESETWVEHKPRAVADSASLQIIRDIEPYKAAAIDKATGQRPTIGGRRQHREFLQRNGYREVGNEYVPPVRAEPQKKDVISDIRNAIEGGMPAHIRAYVEARGRS